MTYIKKQNGFAAATYISFAKDEWFYVVNLTTTKTFVNLLFISESKNRRLNAFLECFSRVSAQIDMWEHVYLLFSHSCLISTISSLTFPPFFTEDKWRKREWVEGVIGDKSINGWPPSKKFHIQCKIVYCLVCSGCSFLRRKRRITENK